MNLLLITSAFLPLRNSGALQLKDLTDQLVADGHLVTIIYPDPEISEYLKVERERGVVVVRTKAIKTKGANLIKRAFGEILNPYIALLVLNLSKFSISKFDGIITYSPSIFLNPLVKKFKHSSNCYSYLILRDIFPDWAGKLGLIRENGIIYSYFSFVAYQHYREAKKIGVQSKGDLGYMKKKYRNFHINLRFVTIG